MKITNNHDLPAPIIKALSERTKKYSRGSARASVTQIISPPRIGLLQQQYDDQIEVDVTRRFWALMGTLLHEILERQGTEEYISEERLYTKVRGWTISGGIDVQNIYTPDGSNSPHAEIMDYKFTSAYAVKNAKPEWESQLNLYRLLVEENKIYTVDKLFVVAFIRDWRESEAKRNPYYPQAPIQKVEIPMWDLDDAQKYLDDRVLVHQEAERALEWGDELPPCSNEERWSRQDRWEVWRGKNQRPSGVFTNEDDAKAYVSNRKNSDEYQIKFEAGQPIRCAEDYCMVAKWCSQWNGTYGDV